jgi:hypothetical protein
MNNICVFNRRLSDRAADYVNAAVKGIDPDAFCVPQGCSPASPAYVATTELLAFTDVEAIRRKAREAIETFKRIHPRATIWV